MLKLKGYMATLDKETIKNLIQLCRIDCTEEEQEDEDEEPEEGGQETTGPIPGRLRSSWVSKWA